MDETTAEANDAAKAAVPDPMTKQVVEATLLDILDTLHDSDLFPRTRDDAPSQFWSAYERVAKQHDEDFLEKQNSDMDVLLIFAGLFSAVNSAFIVSISSSLTPNPSDATNALLMILINKVDNGTFPDQPSSLPVWTGPSSTVIWIQTLAFTSLSTSLLVAFGAVLCKQWLGYFKTSRLGKGSLAERCKRRQRKLEGLKTWQFQAIISTLPIFLQLSLLFFGIALSANIWTQQHTVASLIIGTTALGVNFYTFTVVASLKSPDCPFQTPVSSILRQSFRWTSNVLQRRHRYGFGASKHVRPRVPSRSKQVSWTRFRDDMQNSMWRVFTSARAMITSLASRFSSSLSHRTRHVRLPPNDPESATNLQHLWSSEKLRVELVSLEPPTDVIGARSIQWILETTTDMDTITAAVGMVPEVEWPDQYDAPGVLERLKSHLYSCFDSTRQLLPLAQSRAVACLKAIYYMVRERDLPSPFDFYDNGIYSFEHRCFYEMPLKDQGTLISCVPGRPINLNLTSLSPSHRIWLAHMLTYRLHEGDHHSSVEVFVIELIDACLRDTTSPGQLVANCLLLASLLLGLPIDRHHLTRIDKRESIPLLRDLVIKRLLDVLLSESAIDERHTQNAKKLIASISYLAVDTDGGENDAISIECLRLGFRFLQNEPHIFGDVMVAAMFRLSFFYSQCLPSHFLYHRGPGPDRFYWFGPPDWHTPRQFSLLVDYLMRICKGTDYNAIGDAFRVLGSLHGSPGPLDTYIETAIQIMELPVDNLDPRAAHYAAMNAACTIREDVVSLGRNDASLRYRFLHALASTVRADIPQHVSSQNGGSPKTRSVFLVDRDLCYLKLLCTLVQQPAWHGQLQRGGHFDTFMEIARTLPVMPIELYGAHAFYVTRIFAIIDALGEEHPILEAVRLYPSWPLVLKAWCHIFSFEFFEEATEQNWRYIASTDYFEALPYLVAYAMKYRERWNAKEETRTLIRLIRQVCIKLGEEKHRGGHDVIPLGYKDDTALGHSGIPYLGKQIRKLLWTLLEPLL